MLEVYDLSADHALNPLSFAETPKRLFWKVRGEGTELKSVEVEIVDNRAAAEWASGPIVCDTTWLDWPAEIQLSDRDSVTCRVRCADQDGNVGPWSEPLVVEIALTKDSSWAARWITHPDWATENGDHVLLPRLFRDFHLDGTPVRARLYVTGLGIHETFINGERVGAAYLEPGYADYGIRNPAAVWDVTSSLRSGANRIATNLSTGSAVVEKLADRHTKLTTPFQSLRYLAQLHVELADGEVITIVTDSTWSSAGSDVANAHWYGGEDIVDEANVASVALTGTSFDAVPATDLGGVADFPPLWWKTTAPVRQVGELQPVRTTHFGDGTRVVDFGINIAGQVVARMSDLTPGTRTEFWPAELTDKTGKVDQTSTGAPIFDTVVSQNRETSFRPTLIYHGFRYQEIRGLPAKGAHSDPTQLRISAAILRADLPVVGKTSTSDPFLNRLHTIIDRAVQGNMFSVFTDCPHREKLGWVEQLYLCFDTLSRSYDVSAQLHQSLTHVRDAQLVSGMVPSIAPEMIDFSGDEWRGDPNAFRDDPNWGGVIIFLPWKLYRHYGDRSVLEENWQAMRRYLDYLATRESAGILDHGLGDWIALDRSTPRSLVATHGYIEMLRTAVKVARVLGKDSEGARFAEDAERVAEAFVRSFRNHDGTWGSGSQASVALSLDAGLVPADERELSLTALLHRIEADRYRFTVGENALPALVRVLTREGRDDVVNRIVRNEDGPGYAHQIASGATALTESWEGPQGPSAQGSQNHFMLGMIDDWITGNICGLRQADDSIGWRNVLVEPVFLDGLEWAETSFDSPSGLIRVRWDREGADLTLQVTIPPAVRANVRLGGTNTVVSSGTHLLNRELSDTRPGSEHRDHVS